MRSSRLYPTISRKASFASMIRALSRQLSIGNFRLRFSPSAAAIHERRNITVNSVAPGRTATKLFLDGKPQAVVDHLAKLAPLERLGQPEDIADVVAFLTGPDGAWINGQTLRANGGII